MNKYAIILMTAFSMMESFARAGVSPGQVYTPPGTKYQCTAYGSAAEPRGHKPHTGVISNNQAGAISNAINAYFGAGHRDAVRYTRCNAIRR